ncbi:endonuclease/exonuclease/phosphatase family protein [Kineosporia sp. J2-2]|uniref:Endonuclease/exonuclease/phosphatase family protein n=1 Tax=Kineosporia corallincola TaxID=2835133 RepID=A0ABS5TAB6_9ACTN|nr:endonuclease/exonuclease/phosphatase family protein [Kineosporia corallincola]MBT0768004.1 endonuclease/exonuclease/phosphatase family protein [Kineosporia corallincola]
MTSPGEFFPRMHDESARLRVASLNLFSGRTSRGLPAGPEALAEAVGRLDADVLGIQEVDRDQPRSGGTDQTSVAAQALGAGWKRFEPTVLGTPGEPGWTPATGTSSVGPAYGIGLVSRVPVLEWHRLRLPPAGGRYPLVSPGRPPRLIWLRDEPRVALAAVLDRGVTVVCTHLSFVPGVNLRQLRQVRRWLEGLGVPRPVLVLGDLNLPLLPVRRSTGWTPLVSRPTFPARRPGVQLDHVLAIGLPPGSRVSGETDEGLPVGDHCGVRVVLELPRP